MSVPKQLRPPSRGPGVYVRPEGRQLEISVGYTHNPTPESDPPDREKITGFSDRSRKRLRQWVHAIGRDERALFLSLTYHETDPSPAEAKEDLDAFCKRLRRAYPEAAIIWKMEPQDRAVIHFHLLVYNVPYLPAQKWCQAWHDCTDETSRHHRKAGVDIEKEVNSDDWKLHNYLAKYFDKEVENVWEYPGRWWGIVGRDDLPTVGWRKLCRMESKEAQALIFKVLEEWDMDVEDKRIPSLLVNTRGDPLQDSILGM